MKMIKKYFFLLMLSMSFGGNVLAADCVTPAEFTDVVSNYNNDDTYPIGSTLATNGDLSVIKTLTGDWGPDYFQQTTLTEITAEYVGFHGYLTFDVSAAAYDCRVLTIEAYAEKIIVDGDSINYFAATFPYEGDGFTVDTLTSAIFEITGSFEQVDIWIPTGFFYGACIDACAEPPSTGCLNSSSFTDLVSNYNNDDTYPIGSTLATNGDLSLIKTLTGDWGPGYFQQTTLTEITAEYVGFHGYLTFDVSASPHDCRELIIDTYAEKIIVDGDTINIVGATFPYEGDGFALDTLGAHVFAISGAFDQADVWIPTGFFYGACLDECAACDVSFTHHINASEVTFINTSSINAIDADQFTWDFGDGNTSIENDPVHIYDSPGIYTVCLLVVDWDCTNPTMQHCETIIISGCPTGHHTITPNMDGDADNMFIPSGSKIYDRNGIIVKTVVEGLDWNGLDDANRQLPMGYYVVKCGESGVFNITIIR